MDLEPAEGEDIVSAALKVLLTPDPHDKARRTNEIVRLWQQGLIVPPAPGASHPLPPDRPARDPSKVKLVDAKDVPKRGRGGSLQSRQALLHALTHIENAAVDLAWDIIARFGTDPSYQLPKAFFDDFVTVAADECRHFLLLERRLESTGSHYGAMPAHDGLWESAQETAGSLGARLAVEHCTHEARGLDILPQTVQRFRSGGDSESADLLQGVIYEEEISHCAAGVRWLKHLHTLAHSMPAPQDGQQEQQEQEEQQGALPEWAQDARQHSSVELWFHTLVIRHFHGPLKPPFNDEARRAAGFGPEWYLPLVKKAADGSAGAEHGEEPAAVAAT